MEVWSRFEKYNLQKNIILGKRLKLMNPMMKVMVGFGMVQNLQIKMKPFKKSE